MNAINLDIVIIGGGISGLWTLNHLRKLGFNAILLEKNALGAGQTIASQGIIHGGIKYALTGLSEASRQISDMPARWQACLKNSGELDLSAVNILSDDYYLCSQQKITQRITQFFAKKALHSGSNQLSKNEYPDFFQHKNFSGLLTRVHECVLDVPSLIHALAAPLMPFIFKINTCRLEKNNGVYAVKVNDTLLHAKHIILTAGEGNAELLPTLIDSKPLMQKRPLQMVILTANNLPRLFVHCVGLNTNPVLTITSHTCANQKTVWYLGGQLAEDGAQRDTHAQIHAAEVLLKQQFPWFTPIKPRWQTVFISRAEGFNQGKRPESVMISTQDNILLAWPTKLTFAPLLAEKIAQHLPAPLPLTQLPELLNSWPKPNIAPALWEALC